MYLCDQAMKISNKYLTGQDRCDLAAIVSVDSGNIAMVERGMTFEFLCYLILVTASRMCIDTRALGKEMSLTNPLHGLMFWYIVENFFMKCVTVHGIPIPGLSLTDAAAGAGLSSFAKVDALLQTRKVELTAACTAQHLPVPDLESFFFNVQEAQEEDDGTADAAEGHE